MCAEAVIINKLEVWVRLLIGVWWGIRLQDEPIRLATGCAMCGYVRAVYIGANVDIVGRGRFSHHCTLLLILLRAWRWV